MGWLTDALSGLRAGRAIQIHPIGGSMRGRIESGQAVILSPVNPADVQVSDVVLVAWKRSHLLHLVKEATPEKLLIGNNLGKTNGWVERRAVVGRVSKILEMMPPLG